ncbi:hypothetical protein [Agrobacterium leguminum]|uniref:hypothetical protein n=1 Tax=Agrobacterium leguminum TaxID=2792015 RepID=UPI003CE46092
MSNKPAAVTRTRRGFLSFRPIKMIEIHGCGRGCRDYGLSGSIQRHATWYCHFDQFAAGERNGRSFINNKPFLRQVRNRCVVEAERQDFVGCVIRNGHGPSLRRPALRTLEWPAEKRTQIATGAPVVAAAVSAARRATIPATTVVIAAAIVIIVGKCRGDTGRHARRLQQRQCGQ